MLSLGGKTIIQPSAILRGDLRRPGSSSVHTVALAIGKYSYLGESCVIRPPYKLYKGSAETSKWTHPSTAKLTS